MPPHTRAPSRGWAPPLSRAEGPVRAGSDVSRRVYIHSDQRLWYKSRGSRVLHLALLLFLLLAAITVPGAAAAAMPTALSAARVEWPLDAALLHRLRRRDRLCRGRRWHGFTRGGRRASERTARPMGAHAWERIALTLRAPRRCARRVQATQVRVARVRCVRVMVVRASVWCAVVFGGWRGVSPCRCSGRQWTRRRPRTRSRQRTTIRSRACSFLPGTPTRGRAVAAAESHGPEGAAGGASRSHITSVTPIALHLYSAFCI